jgi:tRNA A-37 threonylcarbamoyl transferase component Bud32
MAKVYKAIDVTLEREVAVKLINPELRAEKEFDDRFQREARIASQLADPHIVVVHDFGLDATHGPYLVMEFLQGQSLRERLQATGPLPLKACLQLAGQLFLALVHAHSKGIVHRDIKPDNIFLLNQSGVRLHVRVLDFGIARIYRGDGDASAQTITHAGAVLGTPRYMSPEQLAGQAVDARSDLYSAALVIWEALTGQLPYLQGKRLCEICPEATPALQDLLEQCLKPSAAERPPTAVEVYLRLQELGKASGILLLPPGAMDRLVAARKSNDPTVTYVAPGDKARNRRRLLIGLAAAAVVLGTVGLGRWLLFSESTRTGGPATLQGVAIGADRDEVVGRLGLVTSTKEHGNPWKHPKAKERLGHVLQEGDLQLKPGELDELVTMRSRDDQLAVIFHQDKAVAVVSSQRAAKTDRGVSVGNSIDKLMRAYDDLKADLQDVDVPGGHVKLFVYRPLGVGFEVTGDRVTGITLFPTN